MPEQPSEAEQQALRRLIGRVLEIGNPLVPALSAYAQELPSGKRRLRLERLANQLEQGQDQIDDEWIPILIAGASSGDPSQFPSGIIDELQREGDLRGRFASALAYPLVMAAASLAILLFITVWIIPIFREMFLDFELQLPALTTLAINTSQTILNFGWVILIAVSLLGAILLFNSRFRDWIIQRMPVVGSTIRLSNRATFTRYLADLMAAEVPAADALRISGRNTGEIELRREANQLATQLDSSNTHLPGSPPVDWSLPRTVVHALQLEANPEATAQILRELSWMYDQQTRNRLAWISKFIEPAFVVLLGTAVGFYVVALFMPLISLIQGLI